MSKLENTLYSQMHMLSMSDGNTFPMPVREFHPCWCCEHPRREHRNDVLGPYCMGCVLLSPETCHHVYSKPRNYRCDFAWPGQRVVVEVEGGVWTQGRHTRGSGFIKDMEKYNALTEAGWSVYRVSQREITSGKALRIIERALAVVTS